MEKGRVVDYDIIKMFGERIRAVRLEKNMTQNELSERCGIAPYYLSRIETGQLNVRMETLFAIAKGLGVNVAELVDGL